MRNQHTQRPTKRPWAHTTALAAATLIGTAACADSLRPLGTSPAIAEAHAEQLFEGLADGGQVQMPMTKTFFSPRFGMVADRFGVSWMIHVAP